ncbi:MAG: nicotinamidase [Acidobacteriota bacterium]
MKKNEPHFGELPLPPFYDAAAAGRSTYRPDQQLLFETALEWRDRHHIAPPSRDRFKVHLLLIDMQKDFCFPEGSLYVGGRSGRGALEDLDRVARFIYRNLPNLTEVTCTMDTHYPHQIFFPSFWRDSGGKAPPPHTVISADDVATGRVHPDPDLADWLCGGDVEWLYNQAEFYCRRLEETGRYALYLWPPHVLLGSEGHGLAGAVHEARLFHAFARGAEDRIEIKGGNPLTENYSVLSPEVLDRYDGGSLAGKNSALIDRLLGADALLIAGEASSHCVKYTVEDLLSEMDVRDASLARKVYLLEDCMSAVAVPDPAKEGRFLADFTDQAADLLARARQAGAHVVTSAEPMAEWLKGLD